MANPLNTTKKIYVALDCLLDLRLGTLVTISSDFAFDVTTSADYYTREQDLFSSPDFGVLSKEQFNAVHKQLAQTVVKNSVMTKMHRFIRELCAQFALRGIGTPFSTNIEVEINTYPYVFTDEETTLLLRSCAYHFGEKYVISAIHRSYKDLTLNLVREAYAGMVMYNYHEWLNLHDLEIKKKPLNELSLYVPRLYFGEPPTAEDIKNFAEHGTDPFEMSQHVLAPLVIVQYLPIALFCVDTPNNPG